MTGFERAGPTQCPIDLATADAYSVLAGSGITNTGATTVTGDVGSFPTPTDTGLGTMLCTGVDQAGNAVTQQAKIDVSTAYSVAAGAVPSAAVASEVGGTTFLPGVYSAETLQINGVLTLDTLGDPNAVFVFQTSTLVTAADSAVEVLDGILAVNVFWQVAGSATLGAGSSLVGTVLASTSITAMTAVSLRGRLFALDGAVTLDATTITHTARTATTTRPTAPPTTTVRRPALPFTGSDPRPPLGGLISALGMPFSGRRKASSDPRSSGA